ncbi:hypothetical protein B296_00011257 [Ensete ventricosum]|uniref:Prolyl 4-hydroxylase alpha subunit Fe(2+) 2OG dioxygenase domain-containing protein n=1 Tax=Ensete ventricosum TaxID=4639 RepID=A0A427B8A3_ENSVE|nr:hypothetical protein B296_00011257 [Ensete ventricosum]
MFDSTGAFLSASEDSSGTLEQIEKKIARVTMLPVENGEVDCLRLKSGLKSRCYFSYIASNPDVYGPQKSHRTSLHGSCPVIKGQKWVATKWIRDQIQD